MESDVKKRISKNTDVLRIENVNHNPWAVESVSSFLKYCCPECDYTHQNLDLFTNHALERHNKSNILFQTIASRAQGSKPNHNGKEQSTITNVKHEVIEEFSGDENEYIETVDEFEPEALEAQKSEIEKLKFKTLKDFEKHFRENPFSDTLVYDGKQNRKRSSGCSYKMYDASGKVECGICFKKCPSIHFLKMHTFETHCEGKFKCCNYCDFKTDEKGKQSWTNLKKHIDKKHPESSGHRHFCKTCNQSFIYLDTYKAHLLSHDERNICICDICGAEYHSKQNLREHELIVHNSKEAPNLVCEMCGFSTISKIKLNVHIYEKHKTNKHKKCSYCDFITPQGQKLQFHMDSKHPEKGEKKFFCNHCTKSFIYESSLKKHLYKVAHPTDHKRYPNKPKKF